MFGLVFLFVGVDSCLTHARIIPFASCLVSPNTLVALVSQVQGAKKLILGSKAVNCWTMVEVSGIIAALIEMLFFDYFAGQQID